VVLIARVIRSWHDQNKAPALLFRSRLYGGFLAAAAPGGETAPPLGSRARS